MSSARLDMVPEQPPTAQDTLRIGSTVFWDIAMGWPNKNPLEPRVLNSCEALSLDSRGHMFLSDGGDIPKQSSSLYGGVPQMRLTEIDGL